MWNSHISRSAKKMQCRAAHIIDIDNQVMSQTWSGFWDGTTVTYRCQDPCPTYLSSIELGIDISRLSSTWPKQIAKQEAITMSLFHLPKRLCSFTLFSYEPKGTVIYYHQQCNVRPFQSGVHDRLDCTH